MILERQSIEYAVEEINRRLARRARKGEIILYNDTAMSYTRQREEPIDAIEVKYYPRNIIEKMFTKDGHAELFDSSVDTYISKNEELIEYERLSNLKVYVASEAYILAMKMKKAKCADLKAIEMLVKRLDIYSVRDLERLIERFYKLNEVDERMICEIENRYLK